MESSNNNNNNNKGKSSNSSPIATLLKAEAQVQTELEKERKAHTALQVEIPKQRSRHANATSALQKESKELTKKHAQVTTRIAEYSDKLAQAEQRSQTANIAATQYDATLVKLLTQQHTHQEEQEGREQQLVADVAKARANAQKLSTVKTARIVQLTQAVELITECNTLTTTAATAATNNNDNNNMLLSSLLPSSTSISTAMAPAMLGATITHTAVEGLHHSVGMERVHSTCSLHFTSTTH